MANVMHFALDLPTSTTERTEGYVREVLDPQIEELQNQLELLQGLRRAICGTFRINRREGASELGQVLDAATRSTFEGDDDRRVPRMAASS
jgi:hypothetical protein